MKSVYFSFCISLCFCAMIACQASKRGCDDPAAVNYAFGADEPCVGTKTEGDCPCKYPSLVIDHSMQYTLKNNKGADSIVYWANNTILRNDVNQTYLLRGLSYFISDIQLIATDGKTYTVTDSTLIPIKTTAKDSAFVKIRNNVTLIDASSRSITVGDIRKFGKFKALTFRIGLQNPENQAHIRNDKMPRHSLNQDSMYLAKDLLLTDARVLLQPNSNNLNQLYTWNLKVNKQISVLFPEDIFYYDATNITIKLNFDARKLFIDTDFLKDTESILQTKLLNNFAKAFTIAK